MMLASGAVCTGLYYGLHGVSANEGSPTAIDLTLSASAYSFSKEPDSPSYVPEESAIDPLKTSNPLKTSIKKEASHTVTLSTLQRTQSHEGNRQPHRSAKFSDTAPTALAYKPHKLEVNKELRQVFDFYLTDWRNKKPREIRKDLSEHLGRTYKEAEQQYAHEIFANYLNYLRQLDKIPSEDNSIESMVRFFNKVVVLRKDVLGKRLANAFFSEDERFDRFTLARQHIRHNQELSELEKNLLINQLEKTLSNPVPRT